MNNTSVDYLQVAINAAKLGAANAQKYFNTNLQVELKKDHTPVTIADKETEQLIEKYISSQIPNAAYVGEEYGGSYSHDNYWLIDPIDGTAFFTRKMPLWSVLITYVKNNHAYIGVSYMPLFKELLYAEKGKGAFLNGKPIHVSKIKKISETFAVHNSIHKIVNKLRGFISFSKQVHKMKGFGDAYGYHLLANGRVDARFEGDSMPYDVAGLNLIIEEAGGKVTNFTGQPWSLKDNTVLATNGLIHEEILKIVNSES